MPSGTAGDDELLGGAGDDTLRGLAGNDTIAGSDGNDSLGGGEGDDPLYGGLGDDLLRGGAGFDLLEGGDGNDSLYGGDGYDNVIGGDGDDLLSGGAGNDDLYSDDGNDTIYGGGEDDVLDGGNGDDLLNGGSGNDILYAGDGNDSLFGGAGNDILFGMVPTDHSVDGLGEAFHGGSGRDLLYIDRIGSSYSEFFSINGVTGGGFTLGDGTVASGIETLAIYTGSGDDVGLFRNPTNNLGDHNYFFAGEGNDSALVDYSMSNLALTSYGVYHIFTRWWITVEDGGQHSSEVFLDDVENITVLCGSGNDVLGAFVVASVNFSGNAGNDRLDGAVGADTLLGGSGADTLNGSAGADALSGGVGNDSLSGGDGADRFIFDAALRSTNVDVIVDFDTADDQIYLDSRIFVAAGPAAQQGLISSGVIVYDATSGSLSYDSDGAGVRRPVLFAELQAGLLLTDSDFVVV